MDSSEKVKLVCHAFPQIFEDYCGVVVTVGHVPGTKRNIIRTIDTNGDESVLTEPPIELKMLSTELGLEEGTYFVNPPSRREEAHARAELRNVLSPELHRFVA